MRLTPGPAAPQLRRISLGSTRAQEVTVRLGILVLDFGLASGRATARAQGKQLVHLSFTHAPQVPSLRTYDFDKARSVPTDRFGVTRTCPMPVVRTESAKDHPMPAVRGGPVEPMPVAKSGCWNPLDPQY